MRIEAEQYGGVCTCGGIHEMATRLCIIERGATSRFDAYMDEISAHGKRCAIYDENTYRIPQLIRPNAQQEIVLDPHHLHANEVSTAKVLELLEEDVTLLIAVGGGTIHDIARYCAKQRGINFISVPTAASCDGFCSTVAAMTWEGYKNTMPAVAPLMVVADLDIIANAPAYLTASGVGDMLGKYTALADWQIARALTGEGLCQRIFDIMQQATDSIWNNCLSTRAGDVDAYEAVTYGLLMSGLAMQMLTTSRPASGGEHHISHLIETEPAALGVHSEALHGEKVGVGTVLASAEYHRLAEIENISPYVIPFAPIDQDWLRAFFGEELYHVARDENAKDCLAAVTPEAIIAAWPEIRAIVAKIPAAQDVDQLLIDLGAKHTLADIGVPEEKRQAILDASPLIRNRLTLMRTRRMIRA